MTANMYTLLLDAHLGLSWFSLGFTLAWVVIVCRAPLRPVRLGPLGRTIHVSAMASTGLAGLTGLSLLAAGSGLSMAFSWAGLAAVAGHGVASARSRKAVMTGSKARAARAAFFSARTCCRFRDHAFQAVLNALGGGVQSITPLAPASQHGLWQW
ncbi:hypothetical protein [Sphingobium yanoikuyae]|uniref:hypothetical protein n=1 Tax=Sphingobium yanoikuyae TaxID=13690 RepID=UPI003BA35A6C